MPENVLVMTVTANAFVKLAIAEHGERPCKATRFECRNEQQFYEAIHAYLNLLNRPKLAGAAISAVGWERDGQIEMPAYGFSIDRQALRQFLNVQRINLVNDFVARALAIPHLRPDELHKISGGEADDQRPKAILGPFVGLGAAILIPEGPDEWIALPTEGGQADVACNHPLEYEVLEVLRRQFGRVSREHVVSLPGLVNIYRALCSLCDTQANHETPEAIVVAACQGDEQALAAIDLIVAWLASVASDTALMCGARGGVYLIGLLLDLIGDLFNWNLFAERFKTKGRLSNYLGEIPLMRVLAQDIDMIGLATLFR